MYLRLNTLLLFFTFIFSHHLHAASNTNQQERRLQFKDPDTSGEPIQYDWSGGQWHYNAVSGHYRVVITAALGNKANKLYIQWWREFGSGEQELGYSLSVQELNGSPSYKFSEVVCLNQACDKLKVKATHAFEARVEDVNIELTALGSYKISW